MKMNFPLLKIVRVIYLMIFVSNVDMCFGQVNNQYQISGQDYGLLKVGIEDFMLKIQDNLKLKHQSPISMALANIDNYTIQVNVSEKAVNIFIIPNIKNVILKGGAAEYTIDRETKKIIYRKFSK